MSEDFYTKKLTKFIEGLAIINVNCTGDGHAFHAEHDVIYAGSLSQIKEKNPDLVGALEQLGFHADEDNDCFYVFC